MKHCSYIPCYSSRCCGAETDNDFCDNHITKKCVSCGEQATHECNYTGQFVCGGPLCNNCHGVEGGGTWGFMGHRHIKKVEIK